ncbi:MAG: zinc ribbon domain-containing protein [Chloroflexi bacterium]|nr:MAG: zinc ribbon domain-containing protein [Chloroflexota bacterium]
MKLSNLLKWIMVGGLVLVILGLGASRLSPIIYGPTGNWAYDECGMWGGRGMMGGWGGPGMMGYNPFGWLGMILGWLIPLGLIALVAAGGIWLVRAVTSNGFPLTLAKPEGNACPSCGQHVQANWRNCPYCGTTIE